MPDAINLASKLNTFADYFSPRTVATLNAMDIMVVKARGALEPTGTPNTGDPVSAAPRQVI